MIAVILAAGMSSRMGSTNKLLLFYKGIPIIRHVIDQINHCEFEQRYVILGHDAIKVNQSLRGTKTIVFYNDLFHLGISSSLACAADNIMVGDDTPCYIFLGDMPLLNSHLITQFIHFVQLQNKDKIIRPINVNGKPGHPLKIPFGIFKKLNFNLKKDSLKSALSLYSNLFIYYNTTQFGYFKDIDTIENYKEL